MKKLPLLSTILLLPPLLLVAWWISVSNRTADQQESVAEFLSIFPVALQSTLAVTLIALAFSAEAAALGVLGALRLRGLQRGICVAVGGFGGMLSFWLLLMLFSSLI